MATQLSLLAPARRYAAYTADVSGDGDVSTFAISTEDRARDGHIIRANGWDLSAYKKNSVVLWAHDYSQPPIGRCTRVWVDGKRLMAEAEFTPEDVNPMGAMVGRMYKRGYLNAVSVGFDVKESKPLDTSRPYDGMDITRAELYEFSAVPVPADPNALVAARSAGIDTTPLRAWVSRCLDLGLGDRDALERAWRAVSGTVHIMAIPQLHVEDVEDALRRVAASKQEPPPIPPGHFVLIP